jgi:hypothetical protein
MDVTSDIGFILRPLLAARGFAPAGHGTLPPPAVPAAAPRADERERASALRESEVQDARVRHNMWLAALGGGLFY